MSTTLAEAGNEAFNMYAIMSLVNIPTVWLLASWYAPQSSNLIYNQGWLLMRLIHLAMFAPLTILMLISKLVTTESIDQLVTWQVANTQLGAYALYWLIMMDLKTAAGVKIEIEDDNEIDGGRPWVSIWSYAFLVYFNCYIQFKYYGGMTMWYYARHPLENVVL